MVINLPKYPALPGFLFTDAPHDDLQMNAFLEHNDIKTGAHAHKAALDQ